MEITNKVKKKILSIYTKQIDAHEAKIVTEVLDNENFQPVENSRPQSIHKIAFIVGSIVRFSGGHTSLLRLGTELVRFGRDVTYISFNNQDEEDMRKTGVENLPSVQGSFLSYKNAIKTEYDVIIATSWQSVYYARKFEGYKAYFVQDFEPYFFKLNERYLLAKKTYELGLHIISLGKWNIEQIKKNCNPMKQTIFDYISFPYEPKEYKLNSRNYLDYKNKRRLVFAVYSKEDGKRIPSLLQIILIRAVEEFKKNGIEVEVNFFGFDKNTKVKVGKNLGKLNRSEMNALYEKADFGIVASMTNISLVPYEMLATGLPVIEFKEGSFPFFFPDKTAILIDFDYNTLIEKVQKALDNPEIIVTLIKNSQEYLGTLSWDNSCEQFNNILVKIQEN